MRRSLISLVVCLAALLSACTAGSADSDQALVRDDAAEATPFEPRFELQSPDGELVVQAGLDELDRPRYRVLRSGQIIINDSTLGLETSIGSFATATDIEPVGSPELVDDEFSLPHGKARQAQVQATTQTVLAGDLLIDFWIADTGVAFRYRVNSPESFVIDWERTSFAMPPDSRTWLQEHDAPGLVTPAYERLRSREGIASNPGRARSGWTFPALFEHNGSWVLITETALGDGAAGSHFSAATINGEFLLDFAARGEGNGIGDPRPTAQDQWTSPWRLIITSTDLGDIVESDLVRHLSPATDLDYSWVAPGRVSWSWWSDQLSPRSASAMEPFIDMAAELGWEYSLVDANWNMIEPERFEQLVDYAAERDVGLFLWYNSGGPTNAVTEAPRDLMSTAAERRAEFARIAELGIVGVKVDFFQSDKPTTIQLYRDILADAASAGLMANFHGSTTPRGWSREFPNLMTMEAVRGGEIHLFDRNYRRFAPWQNTVLPFTRNVVGPMDYTPVILGDEVRRITTNSHELALSVVFESPLLHLVDTPDAYLSQPAEVVDLLASVPTVWDETRLVNGSPGTFVTIARRSGTEWWIGSINGTDEPVTTSTDFQALGIEPTAQAVRVCDNPDWSRAEAGTYLDPAQYVITTDPADGGASLRLVPNGGCLLRITPTN